MRWLNSKVFLMTSCKNFNMVKMYSRLQQTCIDKCPLGCTRELWKCLALVTESKYEAVGPAFESRRVYYEFNIIYLSILN